MLGRGGQWTMLGSVIGMFGASGAICVLGGIYYLVTSYHPVVPADLQAVMDNTKVVRVCVDGTLIWRNPDGSLVVHGYAIEGTPESVCPSYSAKP